MTVDDIRNIYPGCVKHFVFVGVATFGHRDLITPLTVMQSGCENNHEKELLN